MPKMGMAELHPKLLISTSHLHCTSATTSKHRYEHVRQQQHLLHPCAIHLSHIAQDCKRSNICFSRSLKCCLHLHTVPSRLFIPPLITFPAARTSDTETSILFPKLGRRRRVGRGQWRGKVKPLAWEKMYDCRGGKRNPQHGAVEKTTKKAGLN